MKFDYRPLPSEFTHDGFCFRQLARQGDVILLGKAKRAHSREHYEVVVVRKYGLREAYGKIYPPRELMPPSEAWGREAWTPIDLEAAWKKFEEICSMRAAGMPRFVHSEFLGSVDSPGRLSGHPQIDQRLLADPYEQNPATVDLSVSIPA